MARSELRPQKTAMLVAQRIVEGINERGNQIGDRLPPERVMLEEYGVGRGTLRESLRFLELQGVISLKPGPGGGPIVRQPDGEALSTAITLLLQFENAPFRTVVEARTALEPMMARLAAERISDEQIAELKHSVDHMRANLDDTTIFVEMSRVFHDTVARGSGNAIFGYLIHALLDLIDGSAVGMEYSRRSRAATCDIHEKIYLAVADRDPVSALAAMQEHIDAIWRYEEKHYPEVLDTPIAWGTVG
ncbi:FCD domain-containing protein [Gordonia sp. HY285]|uniref:FCD domain-containing protein n=1 Tax=Gordonia liuliyuniae TaxID=2911517 RepID=A0ABS9ITS5_9ACTN|nr:FCD domain-containing protein [Gordonia liuliyuniae]MCF8588965.1 FCD domain-containing protein [Gordonia liuliyuniae]MCF8609154.1 FCD domain-containing protein [Gordonia liuliyuniae]